jgi:electron transport complex protein RnfB
MMPDAGNARPSAEAIDRLLPQTQCTRCGYPGCKPYAEALAAGEADINRCPPGGAATIAELAALLGRAPLPLDPACGVEAPPRVALIDESRCIGCFKCVDACPVDAIVGAAKRMHTVIAAECTGCELCVAPCPVDCIAMVEPPPARRPWPPSDDERRAAAAHARARFDARRAREARRAAEREARLAARIKVLATPRKGPA